MFDMLLTPDAMMNSLLAASVMALPMYVIFKRAGFNPILSLLIFVPYTGFLICLGYLGLKRWPNEPPAAPKKKKRGK